MTDNQPQTEMEKLLARVWGEVLEVDEISRSDTFIDLGGDSMDALQVIMKIEKELGVKLNHERHFSLSLEQAALELEEDVKKKNG
ncbi:MAG: hypothetical protein D6702_02915 [Planctomycetota bacterium]|nr:MAG: hypothetical protein D6702_02915 [Planctomycetota bacterium]